MKILVCHGSGPSHFPSGELSVIKTECNYLQENGHSVECLIDYSSLRWNPLRLFWSPKKNKLLKKTILSFNPDIIHFHSVIPYLGLSILSVPKRYGVPVVQTLHNGRWICVEGGYFRNGHFCDECVGSRGWKGVVYGCGRGHVAALFLFLVNQVANFRKQLFYWVDCFIAVSDFVQKQHCLSGLPEEKIIVNNNGVNIGGNFYKKYEKSWDLRSGVAFAGRISIAKGVAVIKHLIPKIKQPFHIIGIGPELDGLKYFCNIKNFNHVKFWGKQSREKTIEILGGVVCTVVPSQCGDSFPTVALESMALGTPVVASNLGGLPGLVGKGGGTIVNPNEYEQFGDSVLKYLNNITIAEEDGINGQQYVRDNLSMEVRGRALVQIYEDLLSKQ